MSWNTTRHTKAAAAITPNDTDDGTAAGGRCPSGTHSLWCETAGTVTGSFVGDIATYHTRTSVAGSELLGRYYHIKDTGTAAAGIQANYDPDN